MNKLASNKIKDLQESLWITKIKTQQKQRQTKKDEKNAKKRLQRSVNRV
nr:MAG TPA: hypothetical protein [Caudoviricetes sp.]